MIRKQHKILAAVLVMQIVLSVVVFWPRPSTAGQREPLFPDLTAEEVTALTIEDGQGQVIEMERVSGDWVLPEAGEYPTKADTVTTFLEKLAALTTGRLVSSNDTSHERLQVAPNDFASRIVFQTADGSEQTIYVGSSPQYGSVHFRVGGQSETYLTSELTTWDVNASVGTWVNTSYQSVPAAEVTKMTLENANGTFVFEKADDATWQVASFSTADGGAASLSEDETLNQAQVTSVLRRAASVTMKSPLGKEEREVYGLDDPDAVVTLETGEGPVTLRVGAEDADDGTYVVKSTESEFYVEVAAASVTALLENDRDAFIQTPTPEAGSGGS